LILEHVSSPADIRSLDVPHLRTLAAECRQVILDTCSTNGGHLASNLGAVELTIALHVALDTPTDLTSLGRGASVLHAQAADRPLPAVPRLCASRGASAGS